RTAAGRDLTRRFSFDACQNADRRTVDRRTGNHAQTHAGLRYAPRKQFLEPLVDVRSRHEPPAWLVCGRGVEAKLQELDRHVQCATNGRQTPSQYRCAATRSWLWPVKYSGPHVVPSAHQPATSCGERTRVESGI